MPSRCGQLQAATRRAQRAQLAEHLRARVARPRACARLRASRSASEPLAQLRDAAPAPELAGVALDQRVERVEHHLGVARPRQAPAGARAGPRSRARMPARRARRSSSLSSARRRLSALRVSCTARSRLRRPRPRRRAARSRGRAGRGPCAVRPVRERLARQQRELALARSLRPGERRSRSARASATPSADARRSPPATSLPAARQWSDAQASARPMVDGSPRGEPQAGDVSLSDLWSSSCLL